MRNEQIAFKFANGYTKGNTKHLFIENDIIYSYGYHFPISKRFKLDDDIYYLFNINNYSSTTAKHKNKVLRNLPYNRIIFIMDCDISKIKQQYSHNDKNIRLLLDKQKKARKKDYKDMIKELENQQELLKMLYVNEDLILEDLKPIGE